MGEKKKSPADKTTIFSLIIWTALIVFLTIWGIKHEKDQTTQLVKQQARAFFQEIVTTRSWNAMHGGVYVPITSTTIPNPYLKDPERDITTQKGLKLTKINPAFMTRQIAEIAEKKNAICTAKKIEIIMGIGFRLKLI